MKATPSQLGHPHDGFRATGELPLSRRMNLVSRENLGPAIRRAASRALAPYQERLSGRILLGLRAAVERELMKGLRAESRKVRGMTKKEFLAQLEGSRDSIVRQSRSAAAELESIQAELERRRQAARDRKDAAELERDLKAELADLFAREGGDVARLEELVIAASTKALAKAASQLADERAHDERIEMLERRIAKLNKSLESAEKLIQKLYKVKEIDPGIASLYRGVQGLELNEEDFELKKEMLKGIFEANVTLRKDLRRAG